MKTRLFEITYMLLNKKIVPAKELAEHFGVSVRTIYRDIDALSAAGIPVYTEKGKGGGIGILPDFVLNKAILSEKEQNEILSALFGLSNIKMAEASSILQKLSVIFNKTAENWLETDFSDWSFNDNFFDDIKAAILEKRIIEFDYYNSYGEKTFRSIEPLRLWFKSRAWYIKGFCLKKQALRTYRLTRVRNLKITDKNFSQRNYSEQQEQNQEEPTYELIKLRIAPEMTYRIFDEFDENMVEKQVDGSFIADIYFREDNWLYGFILSFGEHIEVLSPQHIKNNIKTKAEKIFKKYL